MRDLTEQTTGSPELLTPKPNGAKEKVPSTRLLSLDTYRGIVLMLLCLEAPTYGWWKPILTAFTNSEMWQAITYHAQHVEWVGCSVWDLIQPSFMFMVGVSMAYSYSKRQRMGDSWSRMLGHVTYRAIVLILLGVFLRSAHKAQTYWTFEDVLSQIGLGYVFLFLLWNRSRKFQWAAIAAILIGYYALFALSPIYQTAGNPRGYPMASGYLANWNLNANPAHFADVWFLNLFPREAPFEFHGGGYNTLNFIPSLAIMILGLIAGETLRENREKSSQSKKFTTLFVLGLLGLAIGWLIDFAGFCPLVKKTWTPTFTIFSGGWCLVILSLLFLIIDVWKVRGWNFPLIVIGMNSIGLYVMLHFLPNLIDGTLKIHLGETYASFIGQPYAALVANVCSALVLWLICFWMYRRKLFLKI
jgi:predicted acyltransferase